MNNMISSAISTVIMGLGATFALDLWALFLNRAFKIAAPNYCLVGRWLRFMPEGIFRHSNIGSASPKSAECVVGWIAHYMISITFAITFVAFAVNNWLQHPTLIPAIVFGLISVLVPFFIMQPAFGLGWAASKTSNPAQARLRSLMNHTAFPGTTHQGRCGVGLYFVGLLVGWLRYRL